MLSFLPLTPPLALIWLTRSFAAASAGPSNGAIAPLPSNAPPITIGGFAALRLVAASALPITASASRAAAATANLPRPLIYASSWSPQSLGLDGTGRYLVNRASDSSVPDRLECLPGPPRDLVGRDVPKRIRPGVPEGSVVGEDLDVVVAVPAGGFQRTEQPRQIGHALARQDAVGPATRRLAPVRDVHTREPPRKTLDLRDDL